jgi:hypothetical protein
VAGAASFRAATPREVLAFSPEEADRYLDGLEARVPVAPAVLRLGPAPEATVFGDTHGDWRTTEAIVRGFRAGPPGSYLIGLGDYVDRPPRDCPDGSVANALFLLGLVAESPDRVVLVKGNHECGRLIPVVPCDLPAEVDSLWGAEVDRYARLSGLLERGPWAALSTNGLYLAHAGFPLRRPTGAPWDAALEHPTEELVLDQVWRDADPSRLDRGVGAPFTERDLDRFLGEAGASIFLRGHDPTLLGQWIFNDRCLTLHSSRVYERYGGVLLARVPLDRAPLTRSAVRVEHVPTEGRRFEDADSI